MSGRNGNKRRDRDIDEPLQRQIETIRRRIEDLEDDGPTPDAKAVRTRFEFLERRIAELERMNAALLDIVESVVNQASAHLADRHGVMLDDMRSPDMIHLRKARHRVGELKTKPRAEAPNVPSAPSVQQK